MDHNTRKTIFCLCVDNFGIKYYNCDDIAHLENTSKPQYTAKIDWEGKKFLGFTLDWNYDDGHVTLSMPNYIPHALKKLQYKKMYFSNTRRMSIMPSIGLRKETLNMQDKRMIHLFYLLKKHYMCNRL